MRTIAAIFTLALAPLTPVHATAPEPDRITCRDGRLTLQFSPGLRFTEDVVRITGTGGVSGCESRAFPNISGASIQLDASLSAQCKNALGPGSVRMHLVWDNGTKTTVEGATLRGDIESTIRVDGGDVVSGPFAQSALFLNARVISNPVNMGADCSAGGLKSVTTNVDDFSLLPPV